jgi:DNA-binding XRE family transcriptional regulator
LKGAKAVENNNYVSPIGSDWDELRKELLSPEERAEIKIKVALLGEIIKARKSKSLTQRKLEEVTGVRQPVIARLENGSADPRISTIVKLLYPLGKTIAVVDIKSDS